MLKVTFSAFFTRNQIEKNPFKSERQIKKLRKFGYGQFSPACNSKKNQHGGGVDLIDFLTRNTIKTHQHPIEIKRNTEKNIKKLPWPLTKTSRSWNQQNQSHIISHTRNQCVKISKEESIPLKDKLQKLLGPQTEDADDDIALT